MTEIRFIEFSQIPQSLITEARRAGLVFCKNTQYIGVYIDERLVGFSGVLLYRNKAVFKNHYVPDEFRRRGIFKDMLNYLVDFVLAQGVLSGEATCTRDSIGEYAKRGFLPVTQYKNNCIKVRCEDLSKAKCI